MLTDLLKIQRELKAPKSNYNSFGKYNYRSCEDILEAVKPLCAKYNMMLTLSDRPVQVGDRYYIEATAAIIAEDGKIEVTASAREAEDKKGMDESQITGTASSYARKYALNGLFLIDDTKDADTDEHKTETTKRAEAKSAQTITPEQLVRLKDLCERTETPESKVYSAYNAPALSAISAQQAEQAIKRLESRV